MFLKLRKRRICKKLGHNWLTLDESLYKVRECKCCERVEYNIPIFGTGWISPKEFDKLFN